MWDAASPARELEDSSILPGFTSGGRTWTPGPLSRATESGRKTKVFTVAFGRSPGSRIGSR